MQAENEPTIKTTAPGDRGGNVITLAIRGILGVKGHERTAPQNLLIELEVFSGAYGHFSHSMLLEVENLIRANIASQKPYLLERIAYKISCDILRDFLPISEVRLTIKKPAALENAKHALVSIRMQRHGHHIELLKPR